MNSLTSLLRSKTSLAISLYLLTLASLGILAHAQMSAMQLFQDARPISIH